MQLVSGREFKFSISPFGLLFSPMSTNAEYGSIIKQVVEFSVPLLNSDPILLNQNAFFPLVMTYAPLQPVLTTSTPMIKFHHLTASVFPQASAPRPVNIHPDVRMQVQWTCGFPGTDVLWHISLPIYLDNLNPTFNGSNSTLGGLTTLIEQGHPGFAIAGIYGNSFMFPCADYGNTPPAQLRRDLTTHAWDGTSSLNVNFRCDTAGTQGSISEGVWRLVHIFSEMTM